MAALLISFVVNVGTASALTASSDFNAGAEGWTFTQHFDSGSPESPAYVGSGGNPGGFIRATDTTDPAVNPEDYRGSFLSPQTSCPCPFAGDATANYGGTLSFDMRVNSASPEFGPVPILFSGSPASPTAMALDQAPSEVLPNGEWQHFSVTLLPSQFTTPDGFSISYADFRTLLANLGGVYVNTDGDDTAGETDDLDNVVLAQETTPPNTTIKSGPAAGSTQSAPRATFGFGSNEPSPRFQCRLDGAAFSPCANPKTYSGLADGTHTFRVKATDLAGNVDPTPAQRSFTVDTKAPQTTITGATITQATHKATFAFKSSEPGSTFRCKLDQAASRPCSSPKTYTNLKAGKHTFTVQAVDKGGNLDATPAVRSFTIQP